MGNRNCKHGSNGTPRVCPECDIFQMARNHYFTGKLLVERDFTDEQRYTMGKLRRHNQHLHGAGVVCGLKVKQHPNPACQSQYVVIEPGTAVDCCGREILVSCEEYFDFEAKFLENWQKQNGPNSKPDDKAHTIQICISYKECPTENVPALFDDCSANASACQPNRILESYNFDVITDPAPSAKDGYGVDFKWSFTENIANAVRVAEHDASKRLYVLTSAITGATSSAALYVIDSDNYTILTTLTYANNTGLDVAVSASGKFVYVALQPAAGAPEISVYDTANFTTSINKLVVGSASDSTLRLALYASTEGSLFAYGQTAGIWTATGVDVAAAGPPTQISPTPAVMLVISGNNQHAYLVSNGSSKISVITLATPSAPADVVTLPTAATSLAIAATTSGDRLAALDTAGGKLYFIDIPSAGPGSATLLSQTATGFVHSPASVLLSPAGRWAYVLEKDTATSKGYLQTVDEHAIESGQPALGAPLAIGPGPQSETLSADGTHLYVPYFDAAQPNTGGVAVIDVIQTDCSGIFDTLVNGCPDCTQGECLVLATVTGYIYGRAVTDKAIDNLKDRHLLVSTDVLMQVVRCLFDQGTGDHMSRGTDGKNGLDGAPGPGLQKDLVKISALSWIHGNATAQTGFINVALTINDKKITAPCIVIAFSGEVKVPSDLPEIFELLADSQPELENNIPFITRRLIAGSAIFPVKVKLSATNPELIVAATSIIGSSTTSALAFAVDPVVPSELMRMRAQLWVRLRGDFVLDKSGRAISAEFVRAELPTGEQPSGSGLGLQGGTFETWLRVAREK